jgi:hypothetical protein
VKPWLLEKVMNVSVKSDEHVRSAGIVLNQIQSDEVLKDMATVPTKSASDSKDSSIADSGDAVSPMTQAEFAALADLEGKITDSWWHTGQSFAQIKELKLYRWSKNDRRQTWEEYCLDGHELTKQQVDKIIRAADVITQMKTETKVSVFPATVSQAVELKGLTPKEMVTATANAIQKAAKANRKPTANDYKQAAADCKPAKTGNVSVPVPVTRVIR